MPKGIHAASAGVTEADATGYRSWASRTP